MDNAQRIDRYLAKDFGVNVGSQLNAAEFTTKMNRISAGRIDPQITEEIWGEMVEAESPPTWRRFSAIFVEAIQRIEGKLAHLDEQIRQAEARPFSAFPELAITPGQEYLVFRAIQLAPLPQSDPLFEFEQNGRTGRLPFSAFRNYDAVLRNYARSTALRVRVLSAATGAQLAKFELWPAEVGQGSRAPVEKLLSELGPNANVFLHVQAVRSPAEYRDSAQAFNAENARNMTEMRGEFQRIKQNIREVFPASVVNYDSLAALRVDAESAFDFQNSVLSGYKLVDLADGAAGGKYDGRGSVEARLAPSIGSYNQFAPAGAAAQPSFHKEQLLSHSNVPFEAGGGGTFGEGVKPASNLSPFAGSFVGAQPERAAQTGSAYPAAGDGAGAAWNPQLGLIGQIAAGLAALGALGCFARPNAPPLIVALAFLFWNHFRNEHDFHLKPLHFLVAFGVCALIDLLWIVAQARCCWTRGSWQTHSFLTAIDRVVVLLAPVQLAAEAALVYFLFTVNKQGVYAGATGTSAGAGRKRAFNFIF